MKTLIILCILMVYRIPTSIDSVELIDGKIEVIKSQTQPELFSPTFSVNGSPRAVWKEIYMAKDGKIVLEKIIKAKVIPAQDERVEFPK